MSGRNVRPLKDLCHCAAEFFRRSNPLAGLEIASGTPSCTCPPGLSVPRPGGHDRQDRLTGQCQGAFGAREKRPRNDDQIIENTPMPDVIFLPLPSARLWGWIVSRPALQRPSSPARSTRRGLRYRNLPSPRPGLMRPSA